MLRRTTSRNRSGVVLLIVIAMLALFAAVGLAFVYYADNEQAQSRANVAQLAMTRADAEPELLLAHFLSQLIYDTSDVYSAMRGHSFARSAYGYNPAVPNTVPFNGTGRMHYPMVHPSGSPMDSYFAINYMLYEANVRRDPEMFGTWDPTAVGTKPGAYVGGANAPWTYPDMQSAFLGAIGGNANNEVLLPSFERYWTGAVPSSNDPWNKYRTFQPSNDYHMIKDGAGNIVSIFPPSDEGPGAPHVKNLENGLGLRKLGGGNWLNDSYWMDVGWPVMTAPNGKKYKALFAALIVDMDGKINLSVHGNNKGAGGAHASNQGWTRSEVNPQRLITNLAEYQKLFAYRYGADGVPSGTPSVVKNGYAANASQAPPYSPFDYDANAAMLSSGQAMMTQSDSITPTFPMFPPGYDSSSLAEYANHPSAYKAYAPGAGDGPALAASQIEALLRYNGTGSLANTSDLFRMMPNGFQNSRARRQVTTLSMDFEAPGASPWNFFDAASGPQSFDYQTFFKYNQVANFFFFTKTAPPVPAYSYWSPYRKWDDPPITSFGSRDYPYYIGGNMGTVNGLYPPTAPFNPAVLLALQAGAPPQFPNTEFGPDWRSTLPQFASQFAGGTPISKLNLNRSLPDYPAPSAGAIVPTDAQYLAAVGARQQFARDIFKILLKVTGAMDPNNIAPNTYEPGDAGLVFKDKDNAYTTARKATRFLAQLAVNIVDYIDNDDYSTPFPWVSGEVLFGCELPRLVLNEAYAQIDNDPADPGLATSKANYSKLNVWMELHNPMSDPPAGAPYPRDGNQAVLQFQANQPVYRVVVVKPDATGAWQDPNSVKGDPNPGAAFTLGTLTDWGGQKANWVVGTTQPNGSVTDATQKNRGFFVLGPLPDPVNGNNYVANADPNLPATFLSPEMSIKLDNNNNFNDVPFNPTLVLQRLACPHLPFDNNPANPAYNPYITVDYMENVPGNENRAFTMNGGTPGANPPGFSAVGRTQPYAGAAALLKPQVTRPAANMPKNTFYYHNGTAINYTNKTITNYGATLKNPSFDWLVHLDRPLASPMELLSVSGYPPHLLTQKFVDAKTGISYQHLAPWFGTITRAPDNYRQDTLLYRFIEFTYTPDVTNGPSYRQPGKVNLNTIFDRETFYALLDLPPALQGQAQTIFRKFMDQRSPGVRNGGQPIGPTFDDVFGSGLNMPFKSLATGYSDKPAAAIPFFHLPNGQNIKDTFLREDGTGASDPIAGELGDNVLKRLFQLDLGTEKNPYLTQQLLNKIYNNTTTRSNVFAIWITVGFFEAFESSLDVPAGSASIPFAVYKPAKLGKEIGRDEGRHIRHRMFAVVDRTQMVMPVNAGRLATNVGVGVQTVPYNPVQLQAPYSVQCKINPGMTLRIGTEMVTIANVTTSPPTITANFTQTHFTNDAMMVAPANAVPGPVVGTEPTFYGNPGPQARFDHRNNSAVVTHYSVVE